MNRLGFNNDGIEGVLANLEGDGEVVDPAGVQHRQEQGHAAGAGGGGLCEMRGGVLFAGGFFRDQCQLAEHAGAAESAGAGGNGAAAGAVAERADVLAAKSGRPRPPLFVKVSPDEEFGESVVEIAAKYRFAGVVATNTTPKPRRHAGHRAYGWWSERCAMTCAIDRARS